MHGRQTVTAQAVEHFMEQSNVDAHFFRGEFIKYGMAGVLVVIITDTRMVSADECMGATVIFHDQRMQHGFARTGKNVRHS